MNKEDYEKYIEGFYNLNPDDLESEGIKAVKAFFTFSALATDANSDQLIAKDKIKKVSARAFIAAKVDGATDNKAKECVHLDKDVIFAKADYFKKLRIWEEFKDQKETTVMKKDIIKMIGFTRKTEASIEN